MQRDHVKTEVAPDNMRSWNNMLNGQDGDHRALLGVPFFALEVPLMFEKGRFHALGGWAKVMNYLYGGGHIKSLLALEGLVPPAVP